MVSKCDLCNKRFKRLCELGRYVRIVHENQRHKCGVYLRDDIHLQSMKSCIIWY